MDVDIEELEKQRREDILEKGEFIECDIVIGRKDNCPVVNIKARKVSSVEMAKLLATFDQVRNSLLEKDPLAKMIYESNVFEAKTTVIQKKKDDIDKTE